MSLSFPFYNYYYYYIIIIIIIIVIVIVVIFPLSLDLRFSQLISAAAITPKEEKNKKQKLFGYLVCGCFSKGVYCLERRERGRKKARMRDWEKMCLKGPCLPPPPPPTSLPPPGAGERRPEPNPPTFVNLRPQMASYPSERRGERAEDTCPDISRAARCEKS